MPQSDFVHLHNHTYYSLLDGACSVKDLVKQAKKFEMPAVALTDHGVMFGAYEFYKAAKAEGVKPIIGCEMYILSHGSRLEREAFTDPTGKKKFYHHLILLAKDLTGYKNLMKLVTKGHTEGFYYKPRIDVDLLREHRDGLVALSACAGGVVSPYLIAGEYDKAKQVASLYKDIFDNDFYIEIQNHHLDPEQKVLAAAPKLAREVGLNLVCTNDSHYIVPEHAVPHNVLLYIKDADKDSPPDVNKLRYGTAENYFRSAKEMQQLFKEYDGAIENTLAIADKINLELPKDLKMPVFPIPENAGVSTLDEYLEKLTWEGLDRRYSTLDSNLRERAEFELGVIKKMGYPGYFLITQDFIAEARNRGVSVGPGRGSAAGSLVAYALGITNVDPIKYNLLFERFLNPDRVSMPDIDIDFSDDKRERVISYVKEKYGNESVAQIITFSTLSARAVLKDVGRVLGVPLNIIGELTECIPVVMGKVTPLKEAIELPEMKSVLAKYARTEWKEKLENLIKNSLVLEGFARASSKHAAGVVIAPGDISNFVPLYKSPNEDDLVTQYSMKDIEDAGLLKMDFLGLRTLSIIDTTLALIEQQHGVKLDINAIPLDDPKTYELFGRGDTLAVFQFDSPPMQNYMRSLKPENMEDLASMNALYRPGPMDNIPDFIDRKHGKKQIEYDHQLLEPILKDTYGVIVFQEQVMQVVRDLAGFTLAKADEVRRAMGKKDLAKMEAMKATFIKGAAERTVPDKVASEIWDRLVKFASYAFNKSHSVAYSFVAYQTAYLKAHYTAEFLAANMTHEMNSTDYVVQLIDEGKRFGIPTLPPDVNSSLLMFTPTEQGIRFGLAGCKNVGEKAAQAIVAERLKNGPYKSIFDFTNRIDSKLVNKRAIEALTLSGAFDSTKPDGTSIAQYRSDVFANIEKAIEYGSVSSKMNSQGQDNLFGGGENLVTHEPHLTSTTTVFSDRDLLSKEKAILGFYVSGHPLEPYRIDAQSFASVKLSELGDMKQGDDVFVLGVIVGVTKKLSREGKAFAIVSVEDFSGKCDFVFWGDSYEKYKDFVVDEQPIAISGKVRKNAINDAASITVSEAMPIPEVRKKQVRGVVFKLTEGGQPTAKLLDEVKTIIGKHKGNRSAYVAVENPHTAAVHHYKLPETFNVAADDALVAEYESAFGRNTVLFRS
ncbi:MAG: DNA polymerase III subunit alpha [Bacteroidetes bacterium]|nr:DNA polymerase III subunit alpha [Bacteroidota bacterium]